VDACFHKEDRYSNLETKAIFTNLKCSNAVNIPMGQFPILFIGFISYQKLVTILDIVFFLTENFIIYFVIDLPTFHTHLHFSFINTIYQSIDSWNILLQTPPLTCAYIQSQERLAHLNIIDNQIITDSYSNRWKFRSKALCHSPTSH
jgi:hypothetical protein